MHIIMCPRHASRRLGTNNSKYVRSTVRKEDYLIVEFHASTRLTGDIVAADLCVIGLEQLYALNPPTSVPVAADRYKIRRIIS
jgi:hypothetical protein